MSHALGVSLAEEFYSCVEERSQKDIHRLTIHPLKQTKGRESLLKKKVSLSAKSRFHGFIKSIRVENRQKISLARVQTSSCVFHGWNTPKITPPANIVYIS